jgi:hypothetical protein
MEATPVRPFSSTFELILSGSWTSFGSGYSDPGFSKDANGYVHLTGTITGGSGTIGTLPEGFRPLATLQFAVPAGGAFGVLEVASTGIITLVSGSTTKVSMNSASFKAFK